MSTKKPLNNRLRVLAFLAANRRCTISPFDGTQQQSCLLSGNGTKKAQMVTTTAMLEEMVASRFVFVDGKTVTMASTGMSLLKREAAKKSGDDINIFTAQHHDYVETSVRLNDSLTKVRLNINESPLSRLRNRKDRNGRPWIGEAAFLAGERLRQQYTRGNLMQKVTSSWDMSPGRTSGRFGKADITDCAIDARAKVEAALDYVGPELAGVLTDICCFLKGFEAVERERRWPPRSAKLMLQTGLNLLARHYGTEPGSGRKRQ